MFASRSMGWSHDTCCCRFVDGTDRHDHAPSFQRAADSRYQTTVSTWSEKLTPERSVYHAHAHGHQHSGILAPSSPFINFVVVLGKAFIWEFIEQRQADASVEGLPSNEKLRNGSAGLNFVSNTAVM